MSESEDDQTSLIYPASKLAASTRAISALSVAILSRKIGLNVLRFFRSLMKGKFLVNQPREIIIQIITLR